MSEWGEEPPGPLTEIVKEDIFAYLNEVAASYKNKDAESLSRLIAEDAEFIVSVCVGDTARESKQNRYAFLATTIPQIGPAVTFDHYDMELISVLEESPQKWVIRCLAKYQYCVPDYETAKVVSEQVLTLELINGYVKVTNAKIKNS